MDKRCNDIIRTKEEFKYILKHLYSYDYVSVDIFKYLYNNYKNINFLSYDNFAKENNFRLVFSYFDFPICREYYKRIDSIMYKYIKIKPIYFCNMFSNDKLILYGEVIMKEDELEMLKELINKRVIKQNTNSIKLRIKDIKNKIK